MQGSLEVEKETRPLYRRGEMVSVGEFRYVGKNGQGRFSRKPPIFSMSAQVRIVNGWESGQGQFYRGACMDKMSAEFIKKNADPRDPYIYFPRSAVNDRKRKNPL